MAPHPDDGPHPEFYYYDLPDLIAALIAADAEAEVIAEQRAQPPVREPDYVECTNCGHAHYDIANNWFVPCRVCEGACPREADPDCPPSVEAAS